jgi:hypothetical protein
VHAGEGGGVEPVAPLAAGLLGDDETGFAQDAQVSGDGGTADARERGGKLARGARAAATQQVQDRATGGVGERLKGSWPRAPARRFTIRRR